MSDARYLAIDPGETSGWAVFDEHGSLLKYGQFKQAEQNKWLDLNVRNPPLHTVITEDYKNHAWKRQTNWSRNQTSKNIGAIEIICDLRGIRCILQPNNVKSIGYKFAGLGGPPTDHRISHQFDAVAHGTYWLRTNGILLPTIPGED